MSPAKKATDDRRDQPRTAVTAQHDPNQKVATIDDGEQRDVPLGNFMTREERGDPEPAQPFAITPPPPKEFTDLPDDEKLRVVVNGEVVYTTKRRVQSVALSSARGEAGSIGIGPTDRVVTLVFTEDTDGAPLHLDERDEFNRRAAVEAVRNARGQEAVGESPTLTGAQS